MAKARALRLLAALTLVGHGISAQTPGDLSKIVECDNECTTCGTKSEKPRSIRVVKLSQEKTIEPQISTKKEASKKESTKNLCFKNGNSEFIIGGKISTSTYYDKNIYMLNNRLPDENFYFKTGIDLNFDYAYGKEKFDHNAVETFINLRYKSAWGVAQAYADRDNETSGKAMIKVADAITGAHDHYSGRNLIWVNEAWLQTSFNAMFSNPTKQPHSIKLGWFPFDLGRGITLGTWYGTNQGLVGLYTYDKEDKYVPGIAISGPIVKDVLFYDLYYGKMEERSKSLGNNVFPARRYNLAYTGKIPWRGVHKDNDLYAARLKWNTFKHDTYGALNLEPYVLYNNGLDGRLEFPSDQNLKFGSCGLGAEYAWKNFEFGVEVATNYGKENVFAFDRNRVVLKANKTTGAVTEYYDHIVTADPDAPIAGTNPAQYYRTESSGYATPPLAIKTSANDAIIKAAGVNVNTNGTQLDSAQLWNDGISPATVEAAKTNPDLANLIYETPTSANRFRPSYTNKLRGWMFVTDAAYKLPEYNLTFAVAYNFASGDAAPYENEVNKSYKGFIGINENYSGKRVPSVLLLDERYTLIPSAITRNSDTIVSNVAFTDMHILGSGLTWTPRVHEKQIKLNPNLLFFWKASSSQKVDIVNNDPDGWQASKTQKASSFMGTEINLISECKVMKNLKVFGKFATFIPGGFFKDIAGIPLNPKVTDAISGLNPDVYSPKDFSLGHDTAYHVNIGLEYNF